MLDRIEVEGARPHRNEHEVRSSARCRRVRFGARGGVDQDEGIALLLGGGYGIRDLARFDLDDERLLGFARPRPSARRSLRVRVEDRDLLPGEHCRYGEVDDGRRLPGSALHGDGRNGSRSHRFCHVMFACIVLSCRLATTLLATTLQEGS